MVTAEGCHTMRLNRGRVWEPDGYRAVYIYIRMWFDYKVRNSHVIVTQYYNPSTMLSTFSKILWACAHELLLTK